MSSQDYQYDEGGGEFPPYKEDYFQRITAVQWAKGTAFLYSGADGMFGSSDGQTWEAAPSSAPASSLAWTSGVWVACGPGGSWRSTDGAKTWQSISPNFNVVVAMTPKGKNKHGVFAGWVPSDSVSDEQIYLSQDLGKTWSLALSVKVEIPYTTPDGAYRPGYESGDALSGCGAGIFFSTIKGDTAFSNGDGVVYSSFDGFSFSRQQVWSGTTFFPWDPPTFEPLEGYTATAVAYDEQTDIYYLTGHWEHNPGPAEYRAIYATARSGAFTGSDIVKSTTFPEFSVGSNSAAGGDSRVVGELAITNINLTGGPAPGRLEALWFTGGSEQVLATSSDTTGLGNPSYGVGSFCFKSGAKSSQINQQAQPPKKGTFACIAFGDGGGGVFVAAQGGSFTKTHSGSPIISSSGSNYGLGAVAVGQLSWLGTKKR